MKKTIVLAALVFIFPINRAHAFIFTDVVAQVQRYQMMGQAAQYISQLSTYRQEFAQYKQMVDGYLQSFLNVYARISPDDWRNYVPTTWNQLDDHYISFWQTFDESAWMTQVVGLRLNPLYSVNADYRAYAEKLISLSAIQANQLKMEEASLIQLQNQDKAHSDDLERFKSLNAYLSVDNGDGEEVALTRQIALTNSILIEMASIQAETKLIEQRLLTSQKEQRNLIMRMKQLEIESQNDDIGNFDQIESITRAD
jgi:hypothetical protein